MSATLVLADTNVISEFVKKTTHVQVIHWLQSVELLTISAVMLEGANVGLA
jgi:toxin FitB